MSITFFAPGGEVECRVLSQEAVYIIDCVPGLGQDREYYAGSLTPAQTRQAATRFPEHLLNDRLVSKLFRLYRVADEAETLRVPVSYG